MNFSTSFKSWLAAATLVVPAFAFADDAPQPDGRDQRMNMEGMGGHGGSGGMQPGHMMGGMGMQGHGGHGGFLHGLNLDEAQRDKIFAIHHAAAPALRKAGQAAHKAHEALRTLAMSGKFDEAQAKSLADTGARAMAEMALIHARSQAQTLAVLTDEQRKKMTDMQNKFKARMPHRAE